MPPPPVRPVFGLRWAGFFKERSGDVAAIVCDTTEDTVRQGYCHTCLAIRGGGGISVSHEERYESNQNFCLSEQSAPIDVQGRILAVWILAAKLPNSDLNFAVDFSVDFFFLFFPRKRARKNPPQNSPGTLFGNIPLGFLQKPFLDRCASLKTSVVPRFLNVACQVPTLLPGQRQDLSKATDSFPTGSVATGSAMHKTEKKQSLSTGCPSGRGSGERLLRIKKIRNPDLPKPPKPRGVQSHSKVTKK